MCEAAPDTEGAYEPLPKSILLCIGIAALDTLWRRRAWFDYLPTRRVPIETVPATIIAAVLIPK
jgi:hypothetical protein